MLESLFKTVKGLQVVRFATLLKRDPATGSSELAIIDPLQNKYS